MSLDRSRPSQRARHSELARTRSDGLRFERRAQGLSPAATATELWESAGLPYQNLPASIVMPPEDVVDAALVGLDQGELVTLPSLHDGDEWTRFEAARRAISRRLGNSVPAPRYGIGLPRSA